MSVRVVEVRPELCYRDPVAALGWLERAFGLKTEFVANDAEGRQVFARISGGIAIVGEVPARRQSPASMAGATSQVLMLTIEGDVDAHCRAALAAGARIEEPLRKEFFGLTYTAADLEGHLWSFLQRASGPTELPEGLSVRFTGEENR